MGSLRDRIRMSQAEVDGFLDSQHTVTVATNNLGGFPHLVALWFAVLDGRLAFSTYATSQKVANLRRDNRIAVLAEDGLAYGELRGVLVQGHAELVTDAGDVQEISQRIADRYPQVGSRTSRSSDTSKRIGIVVSPGKVTSWDHSKMETRS